MPGAFHVPATPAPVPAPRLLAWNEPLALALLPDWQPTLVELFGWPPADLTLDEG